MSAGAWLARRWRALPRLVRVMAASGAATSADTGVLLGLHHGVGLAAGLAAVVGCGVGGAVNFAINRRWVFGAGRRAWWRQAARYAVIVVGGGAAVSGLAVAALVAVGLPVLAAKAGAVVVALVTWTYPMSARVVFAPAPAGAADATDATALTPALTAPAITR